MNFLFFLKLNLSYRINCLRKKQQDQQYYLGFLTSYDLFEPAFPNLGYEHPPGISDKSQGGTPDFYPL